MYETLTQGTNTFHMPNAYVVKSLRVNESLKQQDKTIDFNVTEYDKFYHFYFASTSSGAKFEVRYFIGSEDLKLCGPILVCYINRRMEE